MKAIGYVRVSTEEQANSGLSLGSQRQRITAYCLAHQWELVATYEDAGLSGKKVERPGLLAAIGRLEAGWVLVAVKLDRLTRSIRDLFDINDRLEERGGELACVEDSLDSTTATGRLMRNLIIELSQWEREIISERTKAALAQKKLLKQRLGTTPLGYETIKTPQGCCLVEHPEEQQTIHMVRTMRKSGLTLDAI